MKLLCAFLIASSALLAQEIDGKVVNAVTGLPVKGIKVTIEAGGRSVHETTSDEKGEFRIEHVKAGLYTANFNGPEFLPPAPDAAARRPFRIGAASDTIHLQAQVTPLGRISGRVFDRSEHPIAGVDLLLENSRTGLSKTSDEKGGFSFQVAPGAYLLSAGAPSDLKPPQTAPGEERLGWVRTYYPGVAEARSAAKITVSAGAEMWGQDIVLRAAQVHRLRGVLLDGGGQPAPHVAVKIAPTDDDMPADIQTVSAEDGSFEFPAVHDAEWSLFAQAQSAGVKMRAFTVTRVAGRDLDRVDLRLTEPFTVTGSVTFAGTNLRRPEKQGGVFLKPSVAPFEGFNQVSADRDGSFKIDNVYPGLYKILAISPGPPYFIASITMGGAEALGQNIQIVSGALPIRIEFDSNGGAVRGAVEDCGSATVVLTPQESTLQEPEFVRTARCGESGRFEIPDVRPGNYYAFAFDQWEGPADLLAAMDQWLANRAATVRVEAARTSNVDLKITNRIR